MNRSRQQQSPPNMDEFAQILMDVARRRGMTGNFEYDPDDAACEIQIGAPCS